MQFSKFKFIMSLKKSNSPAQLGDVQPRDATSDVQDWEQIDRNAILSELLNTMGQGQMAPAEVRDDISDASSSVSDWTEVASVASEVSED
jgi:hypothetical protein